MEVGIPGLSDREFMMSMIMIALSTIGAIGSYFFHKGTGTGIKTATAKSLAIYAFGGFIAGLAMVWYTQGGVNIGHWDLIPLAITWGFSWQQVLGRFFGWNTDRKDAAPAKLVETDEPEEEEDEDTDSDEEPDHITEKEKKPVTD